MMVDKPVAAFLEDLSAGSPLPGPESALTLAGALAAALVVMAARVASEQGANAATVSEADALKQQLATLLERQADAEQAPETLNALFSVAQQCTAVLVLAARAIGETTTKAPRALPPLAAAVALARAATEGTARHLNLRLHEIEDDLSRIALQTKAQALAQRARQAEADFLRTMLIGSGR